jgi:hypothetical protein
MCGSEFKKRKGSSRKENSNMTSKKPVIKAYRIYVSVYLLLCGICFGATQSGSPQEVFTIEQPKPDTDVKSAAPIAARGRHALDKDAHVWIFLRDISGGYYLQNPPVEILEKGKWEASNIRIGTGINSLIAIQVDAKGHEKIVQWVSVNRWGKIAPVEVKGLSGYKELARVSVKTPKPK